MKRVFSNIKRGLIGVEEPLYCQCPSSFKGGLMALESTLASVGGNVVGCRGDHYASALSAIVFEKDVVA